MSFSSLLQPLPIGTQPPPLLQHLHDRYVQSPPTPVPNDAQLAIALRHGHPPREWWLWRGHEMGAEELLVHIGGRVRQVRGQLSATMVLETARHAGAELGGEGFGAREALGAGHLEPRHDCRRWGQVTRTK